MKLRACATSGLPVTYKVERSDYGEGCDVVDPTSTTLRGRERALIDCDITATQGGSAEFAPAKPVTHHWQVGRMSATLAITGPPSPLQFVSESTIVKATIRVTSKHPLPTISLNLGVGGQCTYDEGGRSESADGKRDVTFEIPFKLKDPGTQPGHCTLTVHLASDSLQNGSQDSRTYTVKGSTPSS